MQQGMWITIKRSVTLHAVLAGVALLVVYSAGSMVRDTIVLRQEAREMEAKRANLLRKKSELEAHMDELETSEAIEREAKARFNLKKPGEQVVVVMSPKPPETASSTPPGFWQRLRNFFGL